jgi:hypothetical protein
MNKILCAIIPVIIISAFGAVVGVWANDKLQDSKIDILIKSVDTLNARMETISTFLMKKGH